MAATLITLPFRPAINLRGGVEAGAKLEVYASGGLTPVQIFSDVNLTTALPNPLTADGFGVFPDVYYNDAAAVRVIMKQANGVVMSDTDPYISAPAEAEAILDAAVDAAAEAAASASEAAGIASVVASMTGPFYTSTAAGIAATTNGDEFAVRPNVDDKTASIYLNNSGTAVFSRTIILDPSDAGSAALIGKAGGGTVQDFIDDLPLYATRTALAAIAGPVDGQVAAVGEAGASGIFQFSTVNLSAQVTIDTTRGVYVAPAAAATGASGAWVRRSDGPWQASWFLTTPGVLTTSQIVQKIDDLRPSGTAVEFGVGTFNVGGIFIRKPGHWFGQGEGTVMSHTGGSTICTFGIRTTGGTRVSHMRFTGLSTPDNADARFPLYVSARALAATVPGEMEDFEFDHLWFDNCDTGIRLSYGPTGPSGAGPDTAWWTPIRTHIHDCVFDDVLYQPIVPEGNIINIERCYFKLSVKPMGGYRPLSHTLRILGCDRVSVTKCVFDVPPDYTVIATQLAGIDNGPGNVSYRNARNVTIDGNWFYGGVLVAQESADRLQITRNWFWNNPARTDGIPPPLVRVGSSDIPVYFGSIVFENNWAAGYPDAFSIADAAANHVSFKRNTIFGNLRTGSAFEANPFLVQVLNGDTLGDGVTQKPAPVLVEVEDNGFFANPSMVGAPVRFVGNMTGMHLRYSGNKVPERTVNYNHVAFGTLTGDPFVSLSRSNAFTAWSTNAVTMQAVQVGDNTSMPSGFHVAMMATNKFRPETVVGVFPPAFA